MSVTSRPILPSNLTAVVMVLACVVSTFTGHACALADRKPLANPEQSFGKVVAAWATWAKQASGLPMSKGTTVSSKRPNEVLSFEYGLELPAYYYRTIHGVDRGTPIEAVVFWNPHYKAAVVRSDRTAPWRLKMVVPRQENPSEANSFYVERSDNVRMTVSPIPQFDRVLAAGSHRIARADRDRDSASGLDLQRFLLEVTAEDLRTSLKELEITVAEQRGFLPHRIVVRKAARTVTESVFEFSEWKQYDDIWYWTRCVLKSNDERAPVITTTWSIPEDGKSLDHSVCFLSHYGLPEPDIGAPSAWWNRALLAVGIVLVLAAVVYFIRRGRR